MAATGGDPLSGTPILVAGLVVVLAGLWMASTHLPVVAGGPSDARWGSTVYH